MKITVACIAFGIGVCFRCVHVPSVGHAMFAAVLVIAMTPSVGLKGGLLIYEDLVSPRCRMTTLI